MGRNVRLISVALVAVAIAAAACSSSSTSGTEPATTAQATKTVGSAGGTIATPDGTLTVTIPAGALPGDTQITIAELAGAPVGAIGKAYEIGPTGTQFSAPVTLSFNYAGADLMGNEPTALEAAMIAGTDWVALAGDSVDATGQVASGTTMHLSPYGLHARGHKDSGAASDATAPTDSSTTLDPDGSSSDAGPQSDGSSDASFDATFDASGCSMMAYQVGSCANHPVQLTCPGGTFIGSCTNNVGVMGFLLECCPNDGG